MLVYLKFQEAWSNNKRIKNKLTVGPIFVLYGRERPVIQPIEFNFTRFTMHYNPEILLMFYRVFFILFCFRVSFFPTN